MPCGIKAEEYDLLGDLGEECHKEVKDHIWENTGPVILRSWHTNNETLTNINVRLKIVLVQMNC